MCSNGLLSNTDADLVPHRLRAGFGCGTARIYADDFSADLKPASQMCEFRLIDKYGLKIGRRVERRKNLYFHPQELLVSGFYSN